jgi:hypothetical protein
MAMVFKPIVSIISVISWRSVLLVEETGENRRKPPTPDVHCYNRMWSVELKRIFTSFSCLLACLFVCLFMYDCWISIYQKSRVVDILLSVFFQIRLILTTVIKVLRRIP